MLTMQELNSAANLSGDQPSAVKLIAVYTLVVWPHWQSNPLH